MASPAKFYRKLVLKLYKARAKHEFLVQCRINRAFPVSIYRIHLPVGCESLLPKLKVLCINKAIRTTRRSTYAILHKIIKVENELFTQDPEVLKENNLWVISLAQKYESNLKRNYIKKLRWIFKQQNIKPSPNVKSPVTTWDNVVPPSCVLTALKFGPLYAPSSTPTPENIIPDTEQAIRGLNNTTQDYFRWKTRFLISKERKRRSNKNNNHFISVINKARIWLLKNIIVFMKADKTKEIVLAKRSSYNKKLQEYITGTECSLAPGNYKDSLQRRVIKFTSTPLVRLLHMQNATISAPKNPRIFGFAKTHKPGYNIRPVIEKCSSPTFLIEKQLVNFIRSKENVHPYTITNALQLIEKLKDIDLKDNEYMTVMDFDSLYCSAPQHTVILIIVYKYNLHSYYHLY
ncbi:uncharacterized protein LOC111613243 [Centruroides sculpturatus]|uniref:uncharacterized protein LOC111613243 n=1 Tax=Centruroides sculpturatus TaxID=218467 RepID=UPI000C6CC26E|nr:uncharacterized protein LOC111613243 [Centruroides sculpturatus]